MKSGEVYKVTIPGENGDITIKAVVIINCGKNKVLFYGNNKLFIMNYSNLEYILKDDNDHLIISENLFFDKTIINDVIIKNINL
jgi:hypothetical protein